MKYRSIRLSRKWFFLLLFVSLFGCASHVYIEEIGNQWVARPLSELKQEVERPDSYASKIGWKEKTYPLANGYYVYVQPIYEDCAIHWDINPRDRIIGYRAVGNGCEQKPATDSSQIRQITKPSQLY